MFSHISTVMLPATRKEPTYLHLGGDPPTVFLDDGGAVDTGLSVVDFIADLADLDCVRVMGDPVNAPLLVELCRIKGDGWPGRVEVCSPLACASEADRADPYAALFDISSYHDLPPSLGGWHEVDCRECHTYRMVQALSGPGATDAAAEAMMREHFLWPALSFLSPLDPVSLGRLVALIVDPRWYVDLDHPNRPAKLLKFLALSPLVQHAVCRGNSDWYGFERCLLVQSCWDTGYPPEDLADPRAIVWRVRHEERGPLYKRILQGSEFFVSFLRQVWMRKVARNGELFVPELFFHDADVARAFREHVGGEF